MAFPVIPAILAVGAVAWAWWLGKNSNSKPNALELEDEIVEAAVELLPYKEGDPSAPDTPDILSQIAKAIKETGADGVKDIEKVMSRIDPSAQKRVAVSLVAMEFLQWLEENQKSEYSVLALPYRPDAGKDSSAIPIIELDDVYASARKWLAEKQQSGEIQLPVELAKDCGCLNSKGKPKKLFNSREHADKTAAFWRKKDPSQSPQESYPCPKGKGYHLRTKRS